MKFTCPGLSLEFDFDIPADIDEMLAFSAAVAVSTVAEASTDLGLELTIVGLANGVICLTPTRKARNLHKALMKHEASIDSITSI